MGKLVVDRSSRYWVSIFAAFETAAETGVRKDELLRLLVKSISWKIGGVLYAVLTLALRASSQAR